MTDVSSIALFLPSATSAVLFVASFEKICRRENSRVNIFKTDKPLNDPLNKALVCPLAYTLLVMPFAAVNGSKLA
jgi:hypothetical protein